MDPLLIAAMMPQRLGFVAKSTLFANGLLKWFFRQLHMIPIYRAVDGASATDKDANRKAFQKCFDYLSSKGTILLFPEGNSFHEMRLRPLKTGAARIALEYENQLDFQANLSILPIALNYSNPAYFREEISIHVGEPISIGSYKELYLADGVETAKALTGEISKRLEEMIIRTNYSDQEELYKNIHALYKPILKEQGEQTAERDYLISKQIANAINYFEANKPVEYTVIKNKLDQYVEDMKKIKIHETILAQDIFHKTSLFQKILIPVYLLIFLPVTIWGLITNYLPYKIPSLLVRKISKEKEYRAPVMMVIGLFVFPLFYFTEIYYFNKLLSTSTLMTGLFSLSLPLSGFYTLHYYQFYLYSKNLFFMNFLRIEKEALFINLKKSREEIVLLLDKAKEVYLTKTE